MTARRIVALGSLLGALGAVSPLAGQTIVTLPSPNPATVPAPSLADYAATLSNELATPVSLTFRCNAGGGGVPCRFTIAPGAGMTNLQFRLVSRSGGGCGTLPASTLFADLTALTVLATGMPANNGGGNTCSATFNFRVRDLALATHEAGVTYDRVATFTVVKP